MAKKNEFDDDEDLDDDETEEPTDNKEDNKTVSEVEVNLSLLNQKLNYIINLLAKKK